MTGRGGREAKALSGGPADEHGQVVSCGGLSRELHQARTAYRHTREPARCFSNFRYRTRKSWSRSRRVVRKAWLSFSESYPYANTFARILANLRTHPPEIPHPGANEHNSRPPDPFATEKIPITTSHRAVQGNR